MHDVEFANSIVIMITLVNIPKSSEGIVLPRGLSCEMCPCDDLGKYNSGEGRAA